MKNILFVDDEYWAIEPVIDRISHKIDCNIIFANNCCSAIREYKNTKFDYVILALKLQIGDLCEIHKYNLQIKDEFWAGVDLALYFRSQGADCKVICFSIAADQRKDYLKRFNIECISKIQANALEKLTSRIR